MHDQFDVTLEDGDLLGEVELTTTLIIAASESEDHLSQEEIDRLLERTRAAVEMLEGIRGDERSRKMRVGDLVTGLATLRLGNDNPAVTQAGKMVRHVRTRQLQLTREHSRVARSTEQRH